MRITHFIDQILILIWNNSIIYTIDLLSISLHSNSHISLDFDPWLPTEVKGDKGKVQQILSSLMELALEMTDEGEISLKSSLESCNRNSLTYVIAFDIKFTPTTPHSRMITSHLLFDPNIIQRQELIADLKKREKSNLSVLTKFTGIPHLQIGLVRDVIYKLISFMKGTYKVNTRGETVTFHFTIPLGQGAYNVAAQTNEDFNFSISQLRFDENGKVFNEILLKF